MPMFAQLNQAQQTVRVHFEFHTNTHFLHNKWRIKGPELKIQEDFIEFFFPFELQENGKQAIAEQKIINCN